METPPILKPRFSLPAQIKRGCDPPQQALFTKDDENFARGEDSSPPSVTAERWELSSSIEANAPRALVTGTANIHTQKHTFRAPCRRYALRCELWSWCCRRTWIGRTSFALPCGRRPTSSASALWYASTRALDTNSLACYHVDQQRIHDVTPPALFSAHPGIDYMRPTN